MHALVEEFFEKLGSRLPLEALFQNDLHAIFLVKNRRSQIVLANKQAMRLCNKRHIEEMIGLTAFDFHPVELARHYIQDDVEVMSSGKAIVDRLEKVRFPGDKSYWVKTMKIPLFSNENEVVGLALCSRIIESELPENETMQRMMMWIKAHLREPISAEQLAKEMSISKRQLERLCQSHLSLSPAKLISREKMTAACDMLLETSQSITEIALELGFSDHSAFTRHFSKAMSVSPRRYRDIYKYNNAKK